MFLALECLLERLAGLGSSIVLLLANSALETVLDLFSVAATSAKYSDGGLDQTSQDDSNTEIASDGVR